MVVQKFTSSKVFWDVNMKTSEERKDGVMDGGRGNRIRKVTRMERRSLDHGLSSGKREYIDIDIGIHEQGERMNTKRGKEGRLTSGRS